ncbi:MAG TPA: hypothetical protein VEW48_09825, partial [Thermoanaerobaculia bacterium]|nr:hypothetical protein [Thermoanaerobaculia bacterium]
MKLSRRIPLLGLLAIPFLLSAAQPASDLPSTTALVLRARISGAAPILHLEGAAWRASDQLACFYERRNFSPGWSDEHGLQAGAD